VRYQFEAFLKDPEAPRPDNPIHSNEGGRAHGFRGALVGGIHIYGWTTGAFVKNLGNDWLDTGWVEASFRKPAYDGDIMTVNIHGNDFTVTNQSADVCVQGKVGAGVAPWLQEITRTCWNPGKAPAGNPEKLTLSSAPVGSDLTPMSVELSAAEHEAFIDETLRDENPMYRGPRARCHPSWLAGRLIYLLHHSFDYGPAIHTNSHIQHLAPAHVDQEFTITGHCREAFDRNGHHFIVNDGSIWSEDRTELVRLRHTAIFKLRTA
jgi:hypothetical protein